MLTNKNEFQKAVNDFNAKHGCNLDLDAYEASVAKYKSEFPNMAYSLAYKDTFTSIYRQAVANSVINNKAIGGKEMLDEFEKNIMTPYRDACKKSNVIIDLKPYAGMSGVERAEFLKNRLNEAPTNRLFASRELYIKGRITLDDMMDYTHKATENGELNRTQVATIAAFAAMLEETNKNRSIFWRIRHPIINYYERENANFMKKAIASDKCKYDIIQAMDFAREESDEVQNERVMNYSLVNNEKNIERKNRYQEYEKEQIRILEASAESKKSAIHVDKSKTVEKEPLQRL